MGQKYAAYSADGTVNSFYDSEDGPPPQDLTVVEITVEEWLLYLSGTYKFIDGAFVKVEITVPWATGAQLASNIDSTIAQVYSNWTRFQAEYEFREAAALAYKAADYAGDGGVWITAFAGAAGLSSRSACDLILAQSAGLRLAQETLGALRMRKYELLPLAEQAALDKYDEINSAIQQAVALIA